MLIGTRGDLRTAWRRSVEVERRLREPADETRVSHDLVVAMVGYAPETLGRASRVCRAWWQALADLPRLADLVYSPRFRSPLLEAIRDRRYHSRGWNKCPELCNLYRDLRTAGLKSQVVDRRDVAYGVPNAWRAGRALRPLKRAVVHRLMIDALIGRKPTVPPVPRF